ncbi:MAG TPA: GNAT family N-acetyltransferase [Streptosporangiaceae bacterium]|nr:GNAT family N-acetyltransferase [Streptosporangiaceae bacterium]
MNITVVRPLDLGDAEIKRWRMLQESDPLLGNPFLSPEFTQAVGRFRDDVRVAVVTDGPDVVAFFPYERTALGIGHPVGFGLTDVQGIVAAPDLGLDAKALLKACDLGVWDFDHLLAHQRMFASYHAITWVQPIMDLSCGFEAYFDEARLKRFRAKERKLGRDVGELRHEFASTDPADLRRLMALKSAQYNRTGRMDRFSRPWIVDLVRHLHETGFGVLSVLYAGDEVISTHFGLRDGDVLAGWFTAYDTRFAKYSPGLIGLIRLAEGCPERGITRIDMGRGGKQFKERLKSGEIPIAEGRVARATVGAGLHWLRAVPLSRVRSAVLGNPRLYARADRVLKAYARLRVLRSKPAGIGVSEAGS